MGELIRVRREGAVAVVTLDRPEKLNALSTELERELVAAIEGDAVLGSRAVVLAGAGRAFSAGADVNEMRDQTPAAVLDYYREVGGVYEEVAALAQPTVAAIHGYCFGGGFELALACDFRVADEGALFGMPEVSIGILPSSGGTHRLVRLVGEARAKEIMLLRDRLTADEAHGLGLVTEVAPVGASLERALEIAAKLADLPPLAVQVTKRAAGLMAESSRAAGIQIEQLAYAALSQTEDHREAARAFVEKRDPRFTGR